MKIRNLLILGMVLLGFTYCSSDEVLDGPATGSETASNLKMEIAIQMPTGANTRSSTDGPGTAPTTEVGTEAENQANSVLVVLYQDDAFKAMYDSRDLGNEAETTNPSTPFTDGAFITTAEFNIQGMKVGDKFDVYAFVNPYDGLSEALKATFPSKGNLAATIDAITKRTNGGSQTQDNFFMSSDEKVTTGALTEDHISGNPLKVAVNVQRAVARMDYIDRTEPFPAGETARKYKIKDSNVFVEFDSYKLINTSKSFYNFKHVSVSGVYAYADAVLGSTETKTNYVVDTDWASKAVDGFFNYMGTATTTTTLGFTSLDDKSYVTENTTPALETINGIKGHTTAVVFKGYLNFVPGDYGVTADNEDVYVWNNKFYGVYNRLPETIRNQFTGTPTAAELVTAGVTGYKHDGTGYPVYYVYYNKHNDNGNPAAAGPMEFATVRNNIYKLTITSLSKFGHPNDPEGPIPGTNPDPNPENPTDAIETSTLYMQVTATVLDWTVRTNEIEF